MKTSEIVNYLVSKYPQNIASDIDTGKIGLQFGSMNKEVKKVMIALDGSLKVIEEAAQKNVDLIILHHPLLFYPIINLNYDSPLGRKLKLLLSNNINVFSMHTNFDVANGGMNEILANILKLKNIRMVHSEVSKESLIRVGEIEPLKLSDFAKKASEVFLENTVRYVGSPDKEIKTVGIVGGAGSSELFTALRNGCDCLITGEVHHHQAYDALENGIALVEVSHSVERHFASVVKEDLENKFNNINIFVSDNNINPFNGI